MIRGTPDLLSPTASALPDRTVAVAAGLPSLAPVRLLPETTSNRIAAGEVVERPAAAVKELVENALDAGARRISVQLEEGGLGRILVEDDGGGMSPADLALCIERHATSKLPDEATLFRIASLGFRGEALPSIGAVARVSITSRPHGEEASAHSITVEGGRKTAVQPAAGAPGTRVDVRDLFFATPARRKFLRLPRTEADHALAAVKRLALAWPEVGFRVESDGRLLLAVQPETQEARIAALLGGDFAAAAVPVEAFGHGLSLTGMAALPAHTRATAAEQHLVVNRRPVRDQLLRAALRVAYRDLIAAGRHPVAALFLEIPPDAVDVNVHPMKTELRFRDAGPVRGTLINALRRALAAGAGVALAATPGWSPAVLGAPRAEEETSGEDRDGLGGGLGRELGGAPHNAPGATPRGFAEWPSPAPVAPAAPAMLPLGFAPRPPAPAPSLPPATEDEPLGRPLAQLLETYVLAEAPDGALVLVDQHAAHERLTHEKLRRQLLEGGVRAQALLIPQVADLAAADAARLLDAAPDLARLGLEIEGFGGTAVLVRALPALLGAPDARALLTDLAAEMAEWEETTALERRLDAAVARLACHGSVRAGRKLNPHEMAALLREMEATPRAATCSHGRPTFLKLGKTELEKLFGRR